MNSKKKIILLLFPWLIVIVPPVVFVNGKNDIQCKFTQTDSTLSFYGSFKTNKRPACLLEIFLNYNHIKALAPDAIEVQLIEQGNNWNRIRYKFQKFFFFENISVWQRNLDREKQRLDFTLVSSANNQVIMPEMIASSGFYNVKKQGEDLIVEYYQQCQLTKSLITNLYLKILRNEAIHFIENLSEYSNANCIDMTVTDN
jgi:hypothetical protein